LGISRYTGKREFFVMTIDSKFEIVTLWDLRLNCEFQLLGRIPEKDRQGLKTMLMSENQLIEKDNLFKISKEIANNEDTRIIKTKNIKENKKEEFNIERQHLNNLSGINIEENCDEQDIIDNQKITLMQRDKRSKHKLAKNPKKEKTGYDFLERKKKEENRRLEESKGGYQIAVHDFYYKGQKGRVK
jgi:hypothetical protein